MGACTEMPMRCPFHDGGGRFSCHLARGSKNTSRCLDLPYGRLDPCSVLQGRTLVIIGDSLSQQMFDTMRCHVCAFHPEGCSRGSEVDGVLGNYNGCHDFGPACGKICMRKSVRFGWTTHLVPQSFLVEANASRPEERIIVANDGIWFTQGHAWRSAVAAALVRANQLVTAWESVDPSRRPCLLWRETGPQHFNMSRDGDGVYNIRYSKYMPPVYDYANKHMGCQPLGGRYRESPWEPVHQRLERGGVRVVRVWNASRDAFDEHLHGKTKFVLNRSDCTHWCTPGVVDIWTSLVLGAVRVHCPVGGGGAARAEAE